MPQLLGFTSHGVGGTEWEWRRITSGRKMSNVVTTRVTANCCLSSNPFQANVFVS